MMIMKRTKHCRAMSALGKFIEKFPSTILTTIRPLLKERYSLRSQMKSMLNPWLICKPLRGVTQSVKTIVMLSQYLTHCITQFIARSRR